MLLIIQFKIGDEQQQVSRFALSFASPCPDLLVELVQDNV